MKRRTLKKRSARQRSIDRKFERRTLGDHTQWSLDAMELESLEAYMEKRHPVALFLKKRFPSELYSIPEEFYDITNDMLLVRQE